MKKIKRKRNKVHTNTSVLPSVNGKFCYPFFGYFDIPKYTNGLMRIVNNCSASPTLEDITCVPYNTSNDFLTVIWQHNKITITCLQLKIEISYLHSSYLYIGVKYVRKNLPRTREMCIDYEHNWIIPYLLVKAAIEMFRKLSITLVYNVFEIAHVECSNMNFCTLRVTFHHLWVAVAQEVHICRPPITKVGGSIPNPALHDEVSFNEILNCSWWLFHRCVIVYEWFSVLLSRWSLAW